MTAFLTVLCMILGGIVLLLAGKLFLLYRGMECLCADFGARMNEDTNVGLDSPLANRRMRRLAAEMDRQLKELRKVRLRYIQGDQELKNAVTGISHDLRTPLTAICGYMELLSKEEMPETVRGYLAIVENRVEALKTLTEELFRYSVILSVDSYEETEELSLNGMLEECIAGYYGAFIEAGIEPQVRMPEEPVVRKLNRQALSRVFSNIVSNAIKYSDGDFAVILEQNGAIHFKNLAGGLDEVQVGHLFDRFFTVENGRNSTGLGLSIAKTLTEVMHGQIEAAYREEELCITVRFP